MSAFCCRSAWPRPCSSAASARSGSTRMRSMRSPWPTPVRAATALEASHAQPALLWRSLAGSQYTVLTRAGAGRCFSPGGRWRQDTPRGVRPSTGDPSSLLAASPSGRPPAAPPSLPNDQPGCAGRALRREAEARPRTGLLVRRAAVRVVVGWLAGRGTHAAAQQQRSSSSSSAAAAAAQQQQQQRSSSSSSSLGLSPHACVWLTARSPVSSSQGKTSAS